MLARLELGFRTDSAQLKELVAKSGKTVALLIQRDDARIFVPVNLG